MIELNIYPTTKLLDVQSSIRSEGRNHSIVIAGDVNTLLVHGYIVQTESEEVAGWIDTRPDVPS